MPSDAAGSAYLQINPSVRSPREHRIALQTA